jgi:hypothetical protein
MPQRSQLCSWPRKANTCSTRPEYAHLLCFRSLPPDSCVRHAVFLKSNTQVQHLHMPVHLKNTASIYPKMVRTTNKWYKTWNADSTQTAAYIMLIRNNFRCTEDSKNTRNIVSWLCTAYFLRMSLQQTFYCNKCSTDRLWGLVIRVSGYRSRGPGFDSRPYQIFWDVGGLERGPLSLVRTIEELLEWKSSGSCLENRD